jgi:hypothetical protein
MAIIMAVSFLVALVGLERGIHHAPDTPDTPDAPVEGADQAVSGAAVR